MANADSLALGGSYQEPMNETVNLASGLTSLAPAMKACISRLTSGIGKPPTMPILFDLVSLPATRPVR